MDAKLILDTISSVGFPIVVSILLMVYIYNTENKLVEAIDALTNMVSKLNDRMSDIEKRFEKEE